MVSYMEKRKLKVYYGRGRDNCRLPQIVLQGQWLERMGFSIGDSLTVDCQPGRVVITREGAEPVNGT